MIWLIGLGGVLGTLSRFYLGKWISAKGTSTFPWGTWVINLTGSFTLGILFSLHVNHAISDLVWLIFGTGFCGAYTTFSTFGYETSQLVQKGEVVKAGVYVVTSVLLGLLSAFLGITLFR
ncbi:fluoride efflux transporter CrcB [Paenibacillus alginolyticus]|uniref:Fluoride-specific ion channel FluC n=1 Tax=Paenibacillus alginolyticus TaxID=59839 RepID=A0ABT4GDA3_9BACL|nr:fluoride efflux transporter CrcB [Paenibacillus alginolyticus]MCY9694183.1 fluoride efflux transporter CrcB [Paenibacillus alginolyticus]MEC0142733.1 fluoride efflux transporter CrcB [Paenibacillus alginolyticus]